MKRGLVVFRVDAGPQIGLGHIMRDIALAECLVRDGWRCAFGLSPLTRGYVPTQMQAFDVLEIADDTDAPRAFTAWQPAGCDWLVVDHYGLGRDFEQACRGWARRIAVIEDNPGRPHDCALLVDQTLDRQPSGYAGCVGGTTMLACGIDYASLDTGFHRLRIGGAFARRWASPPAARRLLLSFGGSNTLDVVAELLGGLVGAGFAWPVDVAVVGGVPARERLAGLLSRLAPGSVLHVDRLDMAELMAGAWAAIGAGGTMALQRAALGLPSVILEFAPNQRDLAAALSRHGAALSLGPYREVAVTAIVSAVETLFQDLAAHRRMSEAAAALVDGLGARRAAIAFAPELDRQGRPVVLRRATAADARLMFDWQCAPGIRTHARTPTVPTWPEHQAWLARRLADPQTILGIIEAGGRPAGVLRLDKLSRPTNAWEVSILVAPDWQGGGIAQAALAAARRLVPDDELFADVLPANERSHRLFKAAGYCWRDGHYVNAPAAH